jgi:glutamine synthetase
MGDYDSVQGLISDAGVRFIDLKVVDLIGRWRHVTIPAARFSQQFIEQGVGFDGSNYGYASVAGSDLILRPDLNTAAITSYKEERVLRLICDIYEVTNRRPFAGDPRAIARRAEEYMATEGTADTLMMSPEFEFYVFLSAEYNNTSCESYYSITPLNEHPGCSFYHISPPEDQLFAFRNRICEQMGEQGVPVKYHHHEVGPMGQMEIELGFANLLKMADTTLLVKELVRNAAEEEGLTATFMPKPIYGENGNGLHVHQYLASGEKSLFERDGGLSELGLLYTGGILTHGRSLFGLTNPSTNSYRRLVPGYEAPVSLAFGEGNRSAAVRIPSYTTPHRRRIELRTVDATCNPYLAYAAILMAGLDGIKRGLNAKKLGFGPYNQDLYTLAEEDKRKIKHAPTSLNEALSALEKDHDYLLAGEVFDERLIEQWIQIKNEELDQLRRRPQPYEFSLYYNS